MAAPEHCTKPRVGRRLRQFGLIERGKTADLVLLEGNPVQDITATQRINAVIAKGRYLSLAALDGLLADVVRIVGAGR